MMVPTTIAVELRYPTARGSVTTACDPDAAAWPSLIVEIELRIAVSDHPRRYQPIARDRLQGRCFQPRRWSLYISERRQRDQRAAQPGVVVPLVEQPLVPVSYCPNTNVETRRRCFQPRPCIPHPASATAGPPVAGPSVFPPAPAACRRCGHRLPP